MILNHQVLKIINLLRGMCIIYIYVYVYILSFTLVIGSFKLSFMLYFDQKISKKYVSELLSGKGLILIESMGRWVCAMRLF